MMALRCFDAMNLLDESENRSCESLNPYLLACLKDDVEQIEDLHECHEKHQCWKEEQHLVDGHQLESQSLIVMLN